MEYAPLGIADKKTLRYIFASVRAVKEKATRTFSARSDWIASVISQLGVNLSARCLFQPSPTPITPEGSLLDYSAQIRPQKQIYHFIRTIQTNFQKI